MTSIDQIIQLEINPFDSVTWRPGNFWQEQQDPTLTVNSIHQEAINEIEEVLAQVAQDHCTRTLMLFGDSGSGKSYLLGRLKRLFNSKAFFVYIDPFTASERIWRHILRYTVDSLIKVPEGEQEPQLILWIKNLPVFKQLSITKQIGSNRKAFVSKLREAYPIDIYNANEFLGVLYYLLQSKAELSRLACDWLRGDDLDEEDLKAIGVHTAIDNEEIAREILSNFGKISVGNLPIVLCFDQLDNIARLSDGNLDLQSLFSVNSIIHNLKLKNFLAIISIIRSTWQQSANRIQPADRARVDKSVYLKPITLDQAEALWASRLYPLHQQTESPPPTPIYPLTRQALEEKFPSGKTLPRNTLVLGSQLFQEYKAKLANQDFGISLDTDKIDFLAAFKFVWGKELQKAQEKISRIRQVSSPELIQMLREMLAALQIKKIQPKLLPSPSYGSYSLSYQRSSQRKPEGVVWTEAGNMTSFFHVMKACQKAIQQNLCKSLYLIRAEGLGNPNNEGYKRYAEVFTSSPHRHIKPDLISVQYLAAYHSMVNAASSRELVVANKNPSVSDLQALIRESKILNDCHLLQELGMVPGNGGTKIIEPDNYLPVKDFLLNLVRTQKLMGRQILLQNTGEQFPQVDKSKINELIDQLCQENEIQILDPKAKPEAQLVCLVPKAS